MVTWLRAVIDFIEADHHRRRKGHDPSWYNLGAGQRQCVNCLKGGHRPRRPLMYAPLPL